MAHDISATRMGRGAPSSNQGSGESGVTLRDHSSRRSRSVDTVRKGIRPKAVFDIETEGWDRFALGVLSFDDGQVAIYGADEADAFVSEILSVSGEVWAHNGGRYDALWLLGYLVDRDIGAAIRLAGQRVVSLEVGGTVIRDSQALVPLPLSLASQIGGAAKLSPGLPCSCRMRVKGGCGGYCSIRTHGMSNRDFALLTEYCVGDCDITMRMLQELETYAATHDIDLCSTVGASAWSTARRWNDLPRAEWRGDIEAARTLYERARTGYYGGRVECFRPRASEVHGYDINSAYPAALVALELPTGERDMLYDEVATRAFLRGQEGIYHATVHVPDCFIPPLPYRTSERVLYPTGHFEGSWTALELRAAEASGATIVDIEWALTWSETVPLMRPFMERVWPLRATAKAEGKDALAGWLKFLVNSPTGKLAQNPEVEEVWIPGDAMEVFDGACGNDWECQTDNCRHGDIGFLDREGRFAIRTKWQLSSCSHVHWAAYLTSWTRVKLMSLAGDDLVYADTDSNWTLKPRYRDVGSELGQWKYEGKFTDWECIAPKTYRARKEDGSWTAHAKGIPDPIGNWERMQTDEGASIDRGVMGLKSALRSELAGTDRFDPSPTFKRKSFKRTVRAQPATCGGRLRAGDITWPPCVG